MIARLRAAGCVFAEDEADLLLGENAGPARLDDMIAARVAGQPLEHVLGWAAFGGLRIAVDPGVFVPRQRTVYLAERAAQLAAVAGVPVVVDLCCGCGAVGALVAARLGRVRLHAADVDPAAVACARRNLTAYGGAVHEGDLDAPLPAELAGQVDVLAVNAPYVPTEAVALMPPEARDFEPLTALDGGADGLAIVRRAIAVAPRWLRPGGHFLVETSDEQADAVLAAARAAGLTPWVETDDEIGATIVVARH